jgi:phenylacetate-CoA ligase
MYQSRSVDNKKLINDWLSIGNYYSNSLLSNELRIREIGEKNAVLLFKQASKNVPAYRHFLKKHNINSTSVKSISDLANVPPTTKENYITKYSIRDRCWFGNHLNSDMISTSSGTTGKPNYWPRDLLTEINGAYQHEFVLNNVLLINRQKILFINGFAMGNWIAGTFTQACIRLLSLKNIQ